MQGEESVIPCVGFGHGQIIPEEKEINARTTERGTDDEMSSEAFGFGKNEGHGQRRLQPGEQIKPEEKEFTTELGPGLLPGTDEERPEKNVENGTTSSTKQPDDQIGTKRETEPEEEIEHEERIAEENNLVAAAAAVGGNTGRDKVEGRPTGDRPSQPDCRLTSKAQPDCRLTSKSSVSFCVFETDDDDLREEKERFTR